MTTSLRSLALDLDLPERTVRRAAGQGLVRGRRVSARRFEVGVRERHYLRLHWSLLARLRSALRTEPNVRLAVLFGSTARGDERPGSDIDLMVALADDAPDRVYALQARLERRLGREVDVVTVAEAERATWLLSEVVGDGRVLVDRDVRWPDLSDRGPGLQRRANAELEASVARALDRSKAL